MTTPRLTLPVARHNASGENCPACPPGMFDFEWHPELDDPCLPIEHRAEVNPRYCKRCHDFIPSMFGAIAPVRS